VIRRRDTGADACEAFGKCQDELRVHPRIESANPREIEKLKRHVAELQADATPPACPEHIVAPAAGSGA